MSFPSGRVRLLLKSCLAHCVLQLMGAEGSDGPTQQTETDAIKSQESGPGEHDAPQAGDAFSSSSASSSKAQNSGDGGSFCINWSPK